MSGEAKRRGTYVERVEQGKLKKWQEETDMEFVASLKIINYKKDTELTAFLVEKFLEEKKRLPRNSYDSVDGKLYAS